MKLIVVHLAFFKLQDGKSGTKDSVDCLIFRSLKCEITIKCGDLSAAGQAVAGDVVQNEKISQCCHLKCFSSLSLPTKKMRFYK